MNSKSTLVYNIKYPNINKMTKISPRPITIKKKNHITLKKNHLTIKMTKITPNTYNY